MKSSVTAWAICDTDGGRHDPKPLLRHIHETEQVASASRDYIGGFDPRYYPIKEVTITVIDKT